MKQAKVYNQRTIHRRSGKRPMKEKSKIDELLEKLRATQQELEQEFDRIMAEKREQFHYNLHRGKVVFEQQIRRLQSQKRKGVFRYVLGAPLAYLITAPVIYSMIFPLLLLDLSVSLYQHICFRVYGIPRVRRADYVVIDRHHLAYLNLIERINCVFCGYGNGVIAYVREVSARTEQYWCPIKHATRVQDAHAYIGNFVDYGDAEAWERELVNLRKQLETLSEEADIEKTGNV